MTAWFMQPWISQCVAQDSPKLKSTGFSNRSGLSSMYTCYQECLNKFTYLGEDNRIHQGSPVLIPLGSLPPLTLDSQAKVGAPQDHPPYYSPTASTSKRCNYSEPSPSGPRPERLPDPPNPGSPYLDLSPGNPSWFDSPVKASEKPRVGLNSAEKRSASLKRRAECPFVDTSSLLSASEKDYLWGDKALDNWKCHLPSEDEELFSRHSQVLLVSSASESDEDDPPLSPQEAQVTTSDTSDSPPRPSRRIVVVPSVVADLSSSVSNACDYLITSDHKIR